MVLKSLVYITISILYRNTLQFACFNDVHRPLIVDFVEEFAIAAQRWRRCTVEHDIHSFQCRKQILLKTYDFWCKNFSFKNSCHFK